MASLTATTSSPAALPAASTTAPASSVSPAATKRPHLAGDDAPWRAAATGSAGIRPVPRIHHAPVLRVAQDDSSAYALAIMKHRDPIGEGLAMEAVAEAAGPECIVPGQQAPLRLLGLNVWPLNLELKFLEPFGRELHSMKKKIFIYWNGFTHCIKDIKRVLLANHSSGDLITFQKEKLWSSYKPVFQLAFEA